MKDNRTDQFPYFGQGFDFDSLGIDREALTLHLSTASLEPLDGTVMLADVHKIFRNSPHQHKGNWPLSFLRTGYGDFLWQLL